MVIITARSELSYLKTGSARITRTCLNNPPPQTIKTPVIRKEVTLTAQKVNMVVQSRFPNGPNLFLFERENEIYQIPVGLRCATDHSPMNFNHRFYKMKAMPGTSFSSAAGAKTFLEYPITFFSGEWLSRSEKIKPHPRFIFPKSILSDLPIQ